MVEDIFHTDLWLSRPLCAESQIIQALEPRLCSGGTSSGTSFQDDGRLGSHQPGLSTKPGSGQCLVCASSEGVFVPLSVIFIMVTVTPQDPWELARDDFPAGNTRRWEQGKFSSKVKPRPPCHLCCSSSAPSADSVPLKPECPFSLYTVLPLDPGGPQI